MYLNGLAIAVAEAIEADRDPGAKSYRYDSTGEQELFDRSASWRRFREDSLRVAAQEDAVVVQTDVSSFYEHISHHYLQNALNDVFPDGRLGNQVNSLLGKFSSGRSFGLPVGGQASRIFADLFMNAIDHELTSSGLTWLRYVDDYVIVANSAEDASVNGRQEAAQLEQLICDKFLRVEKLEGQASESFRELVGGSVSDSLDDGEAATLAFAHNSGFTAAIDEKKATRIAAERFASLRLVTTVDILASETVRAQLGTQALSDAMFQALRSARMQVQERQFDWVVQLTGQENVQACSTLRRHARRKLAERGA